MARLVVYGRSSFCPDMMRWQQCLKRNSVEHEEFDIDTDRETLAKVVGWTGHMSVPTLVIAPDDGFDPIEEPSPLPEGRGPRAVDRGTMLTEPNPGQVEEFLERNGIAYSERTEGERGGGGPTRDAVSVVRQFSTSGGWRRLSPGGSACGATDVSFAHDIPSRADPPTYPICLSGRDPRITLRVRAKTHFSASR